MRGFSSALVVLELALTLVLLVGAGLMARSFMALTAMNTGIKADHLVSMRINLPRANYPTAEVRAQFFERLDAAPGQPARRRRRGGDDERAAVRPVDARSAGRRPARRRPRQAARSRLRRHQPVVLRHGRRADPPRPRLRRPRRRQGRRGGDRQRAVRGAPLLGRGSDRPPHPHAGRGSRGRHGVADDRRRQPGHPARQPARPRPARRGLRAGQAGRPERRRGDPAQPTRSGRARRDGPPRGAGRSIPIRPSPTRRPSTRC